MSALRSGLEAKYAKLGDMFALQDYFLLFLRAWIAKIFYLAGRAKVDEGFLSPSEMTTMLFEEEYAVPVLDPAVAANIALYAETFFPIMLLLGIGTRFAALGLLGMTLVIQFFVYPSYFPEHATWAAALLPLMMLGAGTISLDRFISRAASN